MDMMKKTLAESLPGLGLALEDSIQDQLCAFGHAMVKQNEVMNLTGITEDDQVAKLHLIDSLTVLKCADLEGKTLIDVGCGAGFPGVPTAIACPGAKVTRAEEAVTTRRESYDFATSRAVARLNILLELTAPYVKVGGAVLALKGSAAREELEEAKSAVSKLGLQVESVNDFTVDKDTVHTVIVLRKVRSTPAKYPRRYAKIKQAPL